MSDILEALKLEIENTEKCEDMNLMVQQVKTSGRCRV